MRVLLQSRRYEKAAVVSSHERARKVAAVVVKFTAVPSNYSQHTLEELLCAIA